MENSFKLLDSLPKSLSSSEQLELISNIDENSRSKLIVHNLRIIADYLRRYKDISYEKEDLFSRCVIALIRAIDTYDTKSSTQFHSYAYRCIRNETFAEFKKIKRYKELLEKCERLEIENSIGIEENLIDNELNYKIREEVNKLNDIERQMIELNFGFNGKIYKQYEIAEIYGRSISYVSKTINRALGKIKEGLIMEELFEERTQRLKR